MAAAIVWLIPTVVFVLSTKLRQLARGRATIEAFRWLPPVPLIVIAFGALGIVKQRWHDVRTRLLIVLSTAIVGLIRHRSVALKSGPSISASSHQAGSESIGRPS